MVVDCRPLSVGSAAVLALALAGCAAGPIRSTQFAQTDTRTLCRAYYMLSHPSYLDPALKEELIRRGAEICVDPAYIAEKQREIW